MYVIVILFTFQAALFQCFSLISALVGGVLAALYSIVTAIFAEGVQDNGAEIAILAMILVLGIIECCAGCGALLVSCSCSSPPPQVSCIYNYPFTVFPVKP